MVETLQINDEEAGRKSDDAVWTGLYYYEKEKMKHSIFPYQTRQQNLKF